MDYEYLEISIGNQTATESRIIGLGEETDARTIKTKDNKVGGLDDLTYDPQTETFIQSDTHDTLPHSSSTSDFTSHPMNSEVLPTTRKRNRMDIEGKSSLFEPNSCDLIFNSNMHEDIKVENEEMEEEIQDEKEEEELHETIRNFNKVLRALNIITVDMMAKSGSTVPQSIRESIKFYPYFKSCIGAIDGTHIPVMVHEGKYFLVDCGFPNRRQFLSPFRDVWYHLQEFCGQGRDPETANELFNLCHALLKNVIDIIFGIFKLRFTIFKSAPPFPYDTRVELVLAYAGLHNFLQKECHSDKFPIELDNEKLSSSSLLDSHEDNFEPIFDTQEQQREYANEWRANLANRIWNDVEVINNGEN
ncbi:hypothetical protein FNV43_RR11182 [Rhamnella rubrinervis]|uniref:DDE Tnp4 domain-containing protein n=1 Tax=Rhamnella rubrinervis TaxID=2594499 RepID=A0A8K0H5H9_9ROSA|nr:hypothetical protein FNV43_RR11182 [Rhamnella rubrinervis]